jgi:hypothetical protein
LITDYASLQASIAKWLDRTDLAAQIPEFIQLAEKEIGRRLRKTTSRATISLTASVYALSSDVGELRTVRLATGNHLSDRPLTQVSQTTLDDLRPQYPESGNPQYFAHVGNELLLVPAPASPTLAEITYYNALTPLSGSNTTNTVLANQPDLYLWGALSFGEKYLLNVERAAMWRVDFENALDKVVIARDNAEWGQSAKQVRLPVVF